MLVLAKEDIQQRKLSDISLMPQGQLEPLGRHRLEIVGAIKPGRAVEIGRANFTQRFEYAVQTEHVRYDRSR